MKRRLPTSENVTAANESGVDRKFQRTMSQDDIVRFEEITNTNNAQHKAETTTTENTECDVRIVSTTREPLLSADNVVCDDDLLYTASQFEQELSELVTTNKTLPCFVVDHSFNDIDEWQSIVMRSCTKSSSSSDDNIEKRISTSNRVWHEWLGARHVQARAQRKHSTQFASRHWTTIAQSTHLIRFKSPFVYTASGSNQLSWTAIIFCVPTSGANCLRANVLLRCALLHAALKQTSRFLYMGRQHHQLYSVTTLQAECCRNTITNGVRNNSSGSSRSDGIYSNAAFCSARNSNARHFVENAWQVMFPVPSHSCSLSTNYNNTDPPPTIEHQTSLDRIVDHLGLAFIFDKNSIDGALVNDIINEIRSRQRQQQQRLHQSRTSKQREEESSENVPMGSYTDEYDEMQPILVDTPFATQIDLHRLALILVQYHHLSNETCQQRQERHASEMRMTVPSESSLPPSFSSSSLERTLNEFLSAIHIVRQCSEEAVERGTFVENVDKQSKDADEPASKHDPHCVVCLEHKATYAVVPCGHLCMCKTCRTDYENTFESVKQCPVCNGRHVNTVRIYIPL